MNPNHIEVPQFDLENTLPLAHGNPLDCSLKPAEQNRSSTKPGIVVASGAGHPFNEHGIITTPDGAVEFNSTSGKSVASIYYAKFGGDWIAEYMFRMRCGKFQSSVLPLSILSKGFKSKAEAMLDATERCMDDIEVKFGHLDHLPETQRKELVEMVSWLIALMGSYKTARQERPLEGKTFVDLFAGIGGFHEALKQLGATCVAAVELDKAARETYIENHGNEFRMYEDIRLVNPGELPEFDILTGGFPCQSFSSAGLRLGYDDPEKGALYFEIIRLAKARKPKLLLLENVEGFANHESGRTAEIALEKLAKIGYSVSMQVLDASEFGVPQKRKRIFIVAVRLDCFHANGRSIAYPVGDIPRKVVADILEPDITKGFSKGTVYPATCINPDKSRMNLVGRLNGLKFQTNRVYSPHGLGPTLCTSSSGYYLVDGKARALSPRECARMQGFPEHFKTNPSWSQATKQFGNAVAVPVVSAVANAASHFI